MAEFGTNVFRLFHKLINFSIAVWILGSNWGISWWIYSGNWCDCHIGCDIHGVFGISVYVHICRSKTKIVWLHDVKCHFDALHILFGVCDNQIFKFQKRKFWVYCGRIFNSIQFFVSIILAECYESYGLDYFQTTKSVCINYDQSQGNTQSSEIYFVNYGW